MRQNSRINPIPEFSEFKHIPSPRVCPREGNAICNVQETRLATRAGLPRSLRDHFSKTRSVVVAKHRCAECRNKPRESKTLNQKPFARPPLVRKLNGNPDPSVRPSVRPAIHPSVYAESTSRFHAYRRGKKSNKICVTAIYPVVIPDRPT